MSYSKRWRKYAARLSEMPADEILLRGQQEIRKRTDLFRYLLSIGFPNRQRPRTKGTPVRFFFQPPDIPLIVAQLQLHLPGQLEEILRQADAICQHRFDLLGYSGVYYEAEVEWHCDQVHGKRAPKKPWYKIPYLSFPVVGDSKITWELNRHQHLVTLAKAYRVTEDKRFADELFQQWYDWQAENPYPIGINWASSLEVGFRSLSWLWAWHLLEGSFAMSPTFRSDLLKALTISARHIERYLSIYFSPNTHLLGEGVALFFIGLLCPELGSARHWQQLGWKIVLQQAERQVRPDGMHFEQSIYYHVYALDFFLHSYVLAQRNQQPVPDRFVRTIERMLQALNELCQTGPPPRLGDDDGGRLFDPRRNRSEHLTDPLATGALLFQRGDFKYTAGRLREETLWLMGPDSIDRYDTISAAPASPRSLAHPAAGLYVMASRAPRCQLTIDAGPQGTATAGHGHADALSIQLSVAGEVLLGDPGTCEYVGGFKRNLYRSTPAHNTLTVDNCDQSTPTGPFAWEHLPEVRTERWATGKHFEIYVGSHNGYRRLADPVIHRRWVFHCRPGLWIVRDVALGRAPHNLDLAWHFGTRNVAGGNGSNLWLAQAGESRLALLSCEGQGWSAKLCSEGWSPVYGIEETMPVLHFQTQTVLPADFAILLVAMRHSALGRLKMIRGAAQGSKVRGYRYTSAEEEHRFLWCDERGPWEAADCESDAAFAYFGGCLAQGKLATVLVHGSYLRIGGKTIFACQRPIRWMEWGSDDDEVSPAAGAAIRGALETGDFGAVLPGGLTEKGEA